ncbi:MAG: hypothetical protein EBU90_01330 [Proteobacteria bacterium]|nr:hypothetical protein [Pseudomonadota bacterium]NBP12803.1 hypothetical protein [bacterium]
MSEPIMIDETLFWRMYNLLRNAEDIYWRTDGVTSERGLDMEIVEAYEEVTNLLADLQPIVTSIKEEEGLYS